MTVLEKTIRQLPPVTRQRMAKLALKGVKFEFEDGRWKVPAHYHGGAISDSSLAWVVEHVWGLEHRK